MKYEISCGFILIHPKSKKILLLKHLNEFEWDLPKGHNEEGETFLETAFREAKEEVQINKSEISIIKDNFGNPVSQFFEYHSPVTGNIRRIYIFLGLTSKNPIISNEHCGFAWCSLEEGLEYLKFKETQKCIKNLYSQYILNE